MKEKLKKLAEVKSIVTFALIGTLCYLAIRSRIEISQELFAAVITAVITYFFTRKSDGEDK
jgi:hypothetical protein